MKHTTFQDPYEAVYQAAVAAYNAYQNLLYERDVADSYNETGEIQRLDREIQSKKTEAFTLLKTAKSNGHSKAREFFENHFTYEDSIGNRVVDDPTASRFFS